MSIKGQVPISQDQRVRINDQDPTSGFLEDKLESTDDSISILPNDQADKLDLKIGWGGDGISERWNKVTMDFTDFNTASAIVNVIPSEWAALNAGIVIFNHKIKHSVAFTGGTSSAVGIELLWGNATTVSFDVASAVTDANARATSVTNSDGMSQGGTNDVTVRMTVTGDTADNLVAGVMELWIKVITLV